MPRTAEPERLRTLLETGIAISAELSLEAPGSGATLIAHVVLS